MNGKGVGWIIMTERQAIDIRGVNVVIEQTGNTIRVLGYEPLVNGGAPGYVTSRDAQAIKKAHPRCRVVDCRETEYRLGG